VVNWVNYRVKANFSQSAGNFSKIGRMPDRMACNFIFPVPAVAAEKIQKKVKNN
jgi:hypothetical protein